MQPLALIIDEANKHEPGHVRLQRAENGLLILNIFLALIYLVYVLDGGGFQNLLEAKPILVLVVVYRSNCLIQTIVCIRADSRIIKSSFYIAEEP